MTDQDFGINQAFVEELLLRYRENRTAVGDNWTRYFDRVEGANGHGTNGHSPNGHAPAAPASGAGSSLPPEVAAHEDLAQRVEELINAYRLRGHLWADLDPLGLAPKPAPELSAEAFGIAPRELDRVVRTGDLAGPPEDTVRNVIARLEETYCRSIGVEYMHVEDLAMRRWLQERMEPGANRVPLSVDEQVSILKHLIDAEIFEQFLHTNFLGKKRFSLEGGESLIPLLHLLLDRAGDSGVEEVVLGMAHRGRLNVLFNIMQKSPKDIFAHFLDHHPELNRGRGDVKYHLGYSSDRVAPGGRAVHLSLAFNPSHLEFVNPVVEGRVRAKQDRRNDVARRRVAPVLIHGDAAFIGQGVVAETLNLMSLEGYSTGGTLHIVVNNQVGFTTDTGDSRSTRYATDLARMLGIPIFHVNGEDPEAVVHVSRLAVDYRQAFGRDVVIDMYCYRKWGHNEGDEPRFTQPVMYATIDKKPSVRASYVKKVLATGQVTEEQVERLVALRKEALDAALSATKAEHHHPPTTGLAGHWAQYKGGPDAGVPEVPTAVALDKLQQLLRALTTAPEGFAVHPKLEQTVLAPRRQRIEGKIPLDWGTAEALAFATLLDEGAPVRLSGQDARRGTFSHRHAVWTDVKTGARYTPFSAVAKPPARFEVWDSPLSETGVLGFDYGYSLDSPEALVIWEAQFGDFANGAQVIIDQFLSSSEDKWERLSGLVLLLPHGFEGQGPEHSSARVERFLQLCAEDNMTVCNLTTPAQIFHALRRQVRRPLRKPLVIMTPKSHLRSKEAVSPLDELATGSFQRVIPDATVDPAKARKVILCSGKVYWDLANARAARNVTDVAVVRLEQLYPLSKPVLDAALAPYRAGTPVTWVQEDPWNMGAWYFLAARLPELLGGRHPLSCVARDESASPATGSEKSHGLEQAELLDKAFA
ncbi:MAG: 2-oxoglutarate dehydrogenase E1 component [Polyangiales bacterium]